MNALIVAVFATLAVAYAAPSGHWGSGTVVAGPSGVVTGHGAIGPVGHGWGVGHGGAVVAGPSGVVTGHGAVGPVGHGWGVGHVGAVVAGPVAHGGAILSHPVASAVVSGPAHGVVGLGLGHGLGLGVGHGIGLGAVAVGHAGLGAITNGGGAISATGHGAAIVGPPTAPVVVAGPSGKIAADGLWGPTHNVGLGAHGGWGHGW